MLFWYCAFGGRGTPYAFDNDKVDVGFTFGQAARWNGMPTKSPCTGVTRAPRYRGPIAAFKFNISVDL